MKYKVTQWGRVYRDHGPTYGIKGVIGNLDYQDVCEQIVHASRRDEDVTIEDENGKYVSVGHFKMT